METPSRAQDLSVWCWGAKAPQSVPDGLKEQFAPATHFFREWEAYPVRVPGAEYLSVGGVRLAPELPGIFRIQFRNELGLTSLLPLANGKPIAPALQAEVLCAKFPSPEEHLEFLHSLLRSLFARASTLPFAIAGRTKRSLRVPSERTSAWLALQILLSRGTQLLEAVAAVRADPERALVTERAWVSLASAHALDADVGLLAAGTEPWIPAPRSKVFPGAAPARVLQRRGRVSDDTPANRFVRCLLLSFASLPTHLRSLSWWRSLPEETKRSAETMAMACGSAVEKPPFSAVGAWSSDEPPPPSVLRRVAYRPFAEAWSLLRVGTQPVLQAIEHALAVRDVAVLYETWVFFELIALFKEQTGESPTLEDSKNDALGPTAGARVRFGDKGVLVYNAPAKAYSGALRPDFAWFTQGELSLVLDAKFRMETDGESPRREDLDKMHAYRDALGVRLAACVYPGRAGRFLPVEGPWSSCSFRLLLEPDRQGIAALTLRPERAHE